MTQANVQNTTLFRIQFLVHFLNVWSDEESTVQKEQAVRFSLSPMLLSFEVNTDYIV